jgi:hypothetical protein
MQRQTNLKIIKSGDLVEVLNYKNPICYGPLEFNKSKNNNLGIKDIEVKQNSQNIQSIYQTKSRLRRLIYANAGKWNYENGQQCPTLFLTLTFEENLKDVVRAAYQYKKFIQKMNYKITKNKKAVIEYVAIPEFQKRGAVHYHAIIFNLPYIENIYDELNDVWANGYLILETVHNVGMASAYLTKYFKKEISDERLICRRRYYPSRGLKKSIVTFNQENNKFIMQFVPNEAKVFEKDYKSDYCGDYKYSIYDLSKFPEKSDMLEAINEIMKMENGK